MPPQSRSAVTVHGPIPADALGATLVHEHIFIELEVWLTPALTEEAQRLAEAEVGPQIEAELRRDPFAVRDNLRLDDDALAAEELRLFFEAGGRTVVDLTLPDIGRDPARLRRIAQATGLNVVMGCGHYIGPAHPPGLAAETVEDIAERLLRELLRGVPVEDGPPVRAGVIGEIGSRIRSRPQSGASSWLPRSCNARRPRASSSTSTPGGGRVTMRSTSSRRQGQISPESRSAISTRRFRTRPTTVRWPSAGRSCLSASAGGQGS